MTDTSGWIARGARMGVLLVVVLAVAACTARIRNHGYTPTDDELAEVVVGLDTRDTVADVIGSPSSSGVLRDSGYYYVSQQVRTFAYQAPEVIERQVVAITFDSEGVVQNIERFALEDGNVVVLSRRVTDSNVQGLSFLRQLLGNIGSFGAPGVGGNDL